MTFNPIEWEHEGSGQGLDASYLIYRTPSSDHYRTDVIFFGGAFKLGTFPDLASAKAACEAHHQAACRKWAERWIVVKPGTENTTCP